MASGDGASYRSQAHRELFADDFYGPMEAGDTERNDLFVQFVKPGPGTDGSDWHYEIPQINAVHVSLPGLCTKEFSFQSLFNPPPNQTSPLDIRSIVTSALGDCSQRLGHLYIDEIIALPVLRHNAGDRHDWRAQLFVHISAYAKQAQFPALDCHVIGNALYDVFLDVDGRLRASVSNWSIADAGGSGCSDPNPVISSLFPPFALFGATSSVFPPGGRKIMAWVMMT